MSTSVKSILNCIGVNTTQNVSILGHFFGFIRQRVPADPATGVTSQVSVLQQVQQMQGRHIYINVIRVGFDAFSGTAADAALEKLDYAVYRTRNIYRPVNLGVGRVRHYFIDTADANGGDDIGSENEADDLSDDWSVPDSGIDAFVVRNISDSDFVGISPVDGSCNKPSKRDGLLAGEIGRNSEPFSRTFAHEIGHFLGRSHNHGDNCPTSNAGRNNLMAQTRCSISTRTSVLLTSGQGSTMRSHCSVRNGC